MHICGIYGDDFVFLVFLYVFVVLVTDLVAVESNVVC
jgi:hypothetical protein